MRTLLTRVFLIVCSIFFQNISDDRPPCIRHVESFIYDPVARASRIQGEVSIAVDVSAKGDVTRVICLAGHPLLFDMASKNISAWKFEPTGKAYSINLLYDFRLSEPAVYENVPVKLVVEWPSRISAIGNMAKKTQD